MRYLRMSTSFEEVKKPGEVADCVIHGKDAWGIEQTARVRFNPPPHAINGIRTSTHRSLFRFAHRNLCFAEVDRVEVFGKYKSSIYVEGDPAPTETIPR